jgi:hypothetical protein
MRTSFEKLRAIDTSAAEPIKEMIKTRSSLTLHLFEKHPRHHLKNFQGALQADAYAGFHHLYDGGVIYEVACRVGEYVFDSKQ